MQDYIILYEKEDSQKTTELAPTNAPPPPANTAKLSSVNLPYLSTFFFLFPV
jgi:hypothetical protein